MARRRWQTWIWEVVKGWGLYAVAMAFVAFAARLRNVALLLVACGVLAVAGILFQGQLGHRSVRTGVRLLMAGAFLVVGAVGLWVWSVGGHTEGWGFLGITTLLFGVFQLLALLRTGRFLAPWRGPGLLVISAGLVVAGLLVFGPDRPGLALQLVGAGAGVVALGLPLMSEDLLDRIGKDAWSPWAAALAALLGLMLIAAAIDAFVLLGATVWFGVLAALMLTAAVGALASRNDADLIIIVVALMLSWALLPRDAAPLQYRPAGRQVVVSLGDSYISGEGAKSFYEGTNTKGLNQCRRAPTAYSPIMAATRHDAPLFLACSGAKAIDIWGHDQYEGEPLPELIPRTPDRTDSKGLSQLAQYRTLKTSPFAVSLVLVSIGGNDAGFADIGKTCVAPGNCAETGQRWLDGLVGVAAQVRSAYAEIRREFPDTPVLVIPYPVQLNPAGCAESLLSAPEHRFLAGFVTELNSVLRHEAARDGIQFHYVDTVPDSLVPGHLRLCDGKFRTAGINFFAANPVSGLLDDSVNPQNWVHDSFHPNEKGHAAILAAIESWIGNHSPLPALAPKDPSIGEYTRARLEVVMNDPSFPHCASSTHRSSYCHSSSGVDVGQWTRSQVLHWLRKISVPLAGLLAGAWLLWMALIARWQRTGWTLGTKAALGHRLTKRWRPT